jgi:hypothetical protein
MLPLTCFLLTVPSLQWRVFKALHEVEDEIEWRHLDNLERLALISWQQHFPTNVPLPERPPRDTIGVEIFVNLFGYDFLKAATPLGT